MYRFEALKKKLEGGIGFDGERGTKKSSGFWITEVEAKLFAADDLKGATEREKKEGIDWMRTDTLIQKYLLGEMEARKEDPRVDSMDPCGPPDEHRIVFLYLNRDSFSERGAPFTVSRRSTGLGSCGTPRQLRFKA
mmetsp:Transcript_24870/g.62167  ORF Transcript_24870/g.62167 Transcript_24870/m.62167 type:complete len:136 (-) Transcript_24870:826-1233(-)